MKYGVYTAILHDRPLPEALTVIKELGLDAAEINVGGFLPPIHIPTIDDLLTSDAARDDYLGIFAEAGVELAGLNANGNPLHPNPEIGPPTLSDIERAIKVANRLGQTRVVTMSGLPGSDSSATTPSWIVNPWESSFLDIRDAQWEAATPVWRALDRLAADNGVQIAIEMHPHNLVFNPATLERLVETTGATNVGAEMDPSHLFWQGIDPVAAVDHLGELVVHAAAKDVRINDAAKIHGVLDDRHTRFTGDRITNIRGGAAISAWPEGSAWDFVALGKGHDQDFWNRFVAALNRVDPDMAVHIEHEDESLGRIEGLQTAAEVLLTAAHNV
ncbi:sugar phosphate isomerase/epimerase family protein [Brevibacterium sediminis]|uniref:Sugar phosphate isomerase/epimerase n=1 Tax=Brevibacterium sediminis TaxID=1857024 RepID=A0A5C4X2T9_9MICO|nr:sugar phosphate isomerase/epimerase [Brevibacterium sediminis]TNM55841.1 sugar phosphate isomerase/epimerase [Brevibacterium sediminis]